MNSSGVWFTSDRWCLNDFAGSSFLIILEIDRLHDSNFLTSKNLRSRSLLKQLNCLNPILK